MTSIRCRRASRCRFSAKPSAHDSATDPLVVTLREVVLKEPAEQVPQMAFPARSVRSDADPGDSHGTRLHVHDKEHQCADRPEEAQDLDAEEVARILRLRVA